MYWSAFYMVNQLRFFPLTNILHGYCYIWNCIFLHPIWTVFRHDSKSDMYLILYLGIWPAMSKHSYLILFLFMNVFFTVTWLLVFVFIFKRRSNSQTCYCTMMGPKIYRIGKGPWARNQNRDAQSAMVLCWRAAHEVIGVDKTLVS